MFRLQKYKLETPLELVNKILAIILFSLDNIAITKLNVELWEQRPWLRQVKNNKQSDQTQSLRLSFTECMNTSDFCRNLEMWN